MKGFYWGTGVVRCSFCGGRHHNITTCKRVAEVAKRTINKIEEDSSYAISAHEYKAFDELRKREERIIKRKNKVKKRPPRCSFCHEHGHKRPKCSKLQDFKKMVYDANSAWKRALSSKLNDCGLGVGSLIKLNKQAIDEYAHDYGNTVVGLITSFNLKDFNVFCALKENSIYQNNSSSFQFLYDGSFANVNMKYLSKSLEGDLIHSNWWYSSPVSGSVLSPMKHRLDEKWINNNCDEKLDWFFSSVRLDTLIELGVYQFLEKWSKK